MITAPNQTSNKTNNEGLALLARLFWMVVGNFVLVISLFIIFVHKQGFGQTTDFVFWITVAMLVLVRYLDIKHCQGQTVTGSPATMYHWRRYATLLAILSFALWTLAHIYVYFMSKPVAPI